MVKSGVYQDLWVCNITNNPIELYKTSIMRCPPIGLAEAVAADFIIVKESDEYPCQVNKNCLAPEYTNNIKYSRELKVPVAPYFDETYHKHTSLDEVSHLVDDIQWSKYDIVLCINTCIPNRIIEKYPKTLWCYWVGENNSDIMDYKIGLYDIILNQDVLKMNLPHYSIGFPYSFVGTHTMENIAKSLLDVEDIIKQGIYMEVKNTEERPVKTIPDDFRLISERLGMDIIVHSQDILENAKRIYKSKYFVKLTGLIIRGNGLLECISAGTLILANGSLVILDTLVLDECRVNSVEDVYSKIKYFEEHPEAYTNCIHKQRAILKQYYFNYPLDNLINKYNNKIENSLYSVYTPESYFNSIFGTSLVWITIINKAYINFTKNFLKSMEVNRCPFKLVVYCIDKEIIEELSEYPNAICFDASCFLKERMTSNFTEWFSIDYRKICFSKLDAINYTVNLCNKYGIWAVGYIDTDVITLKDPTSAILNAMHHNRDSVIFSQCDEDSMTCSNMHSCNAFCAGIIVFRTGSIDTSIFNYSNDDILKYNSDQDYLLDIVTKKQIKRLTIPKDVFLNGSYPGLKGHGELKLPESAALVHYNYMKGSEKEPYMRSNSMWYI